MLYPFRHEALSKSHLELYVFPSEPQTKFLKKERSGHQKEHSEMMGWKLLFCSKIDVKIDLIFLVKKALPELSDLKNDLLYKS